MFYFSTLLFLFVSFTIKAYATSPDSVFNSSFESLKELVASQKANTVEDFLPLWKNKSPIFFKKYLLGYRSRSFQNSSPLSPRVIMFSKTTDLVISFNGSSQHRGFNDLEVMAFNYQTDSFEFYELTSDSLRSGQFPSVNPRKCLECHQSSARSSMTRNPVDPRPNWEPYNTWPGFFGSLDDNLDAEKAKFASSAAKFNSQPIDQLLIYEASKEPEWFNTFYSQIQPYHQRYSLLDPIEPREGKVDEKVVNVEFTKRLSILNFRRVLRLMTEETEVFNFIKWNLANVIRCSAPIASDTILNFVDPNFLTKKNQYGTSRLFSDMIQMYYNYFGVDTEDWSMDFKTDGGRFSFAERFGTPNDPWQEARSGFEKYILNREDIKNLNCDQLQTKADLQFNNLDALKKFKQERNLLLAKNSNSSLQPLLQRCISCHVTLNTGDIPYIPFNDVNQLNKKLKQSGYKRGTLLDEIRWRVGDHVTVDEQMPPRGVPSAQQRKDLIDELTQISLLPEKR